MEMVLEARAALQTGSLPISSAAQAAEGQLVALTASQEARRAFLGRMDVYFWSDHGPAGASRYPMVLRHPCGCDDATEAPDQDRLAFAPTTDSRYDYHSVEPFALTSAGINDEWHFRSLAVAHNIMRMIHQLIRTVGRDPQTATVEELDGLGPPVWQCAPSVRRNRRQLDPCNIGPRSGRRVFSGLLMHVCAWHSASEHHADNVWIYLDPSEPNIIGTLRAVAPHFEHQPWLGFCTICPTAIVRDSSIHDIREHLWDV